MRMTWIRIASGNTASSLEMYQKDYQRQCIPTRLEKDVNGTWRLLIQVENKLHPEDEEVSE